jgi:7-keto-8-aminopelargonate synthetase-like enzyme
MLGPPVKFVERDYVILEGKKLLYLSGIDYHRLSSAPEILKTLSEAAFEYGISPTGSRTTVGNHFLYVELERKAAEFFDTEASTLLAGGYLANTVLLQAVAEEYDIFFLDEASHSSLADAARLFGREMIYFNHLEPQSLEENLRRHLKGNSKPLILTDGVFPARGEIPPLDHYVEIAKRYETKILVDDAHALAVVGEKGMGSWEEKGIDREFIYQTGTLSKGFGVFGGIIPGDIPLISAIREKSPAFIGATGMPLPIAAAAIKSFEYLKANRQRIADLRRRSLELKKKFRTLGFDLPASPAPIFSITFNDESRNKRLYRVLLERGVFPPFINYPGAPRGGHFRFIITSLTTDEQIGLLLQAVISAF